MGDDTGELNGELIPVSWKLRGKSFTSESIDAFLIDLLELLLSLHPDTFSELEDLAFEIFLSTSPDNLADPKQLGSSQCYFENELGSNEVIISSYCLIEELGFPLDLLEVTYPEKVTGPADVILWNYRNNEREFEPDESYDHSAKPLSFRLFEESYETEFDVKMLEKVYEKMYELRGSKFSKILNEPWNLWPLISSNAEAYEEFANKKQIEKSKYYFDLEHAIFYKGEHAVDKVCERVIEILGYSEGDFEFEVGK